MKWVAKHTRKMVLFIILCVCTLLLVANVFGIEEKKDRSKATFIKKRGYYIECERSDAPLLSVEELQHWMETELLEQKLIEYFNPRLVAYGDVPTLKFKSEYFAIVREPTGSPVSK
ncbi:hypothetical protein FACS189418_8890 [Clostridia bacterium]|nr:hypothetical protein FACS189418_8890 [Clostridia bacterium]